ncbi:MAG: hypothetical protein LBI19_03175 [Oscillospiraceae bacterium]|jgi:hypothetical protein|nr:hypothetical protein [Oscillospiraceae bacterium]
MKRLKPAWIRKLNEIRKELEGWTCDHTHIARLRTNKIIEDILPGPGRVNITYTRNIMTALKYARTHFHFVTHNSMLVDIMAGKRIKISNYNVKGEMYQ